MKHALFFFPKGCKFISHEGDWDKTFSAATEELRKNMAEVAKRFGQVPPELGEHHWIACFGNETGEKCFWLVEGSAPNFTPGPYQAWPTAVAPVGSECWVITDGDGDMICEVTNLVGAEAIISHLNR